MKPISLNYSRKKALSLCTLIKGTMKESSWTKELHSNSL